jgi:cytochrome c553
MLKKLSVVLIATLAIGFAASVKAADAKENFEKYCGTCHGKDGKGQTKLGQKLEVRDYTNPEVQKKIKDEEMFKAIKEGLKKGDTSLMKPFDKLTDDEIKELVQYMRKFKK